MPTPTLFDIAMRQQFPRRSTRPFPVKSIPRAPEVVEAASTMDAAIDALPLSGRVEVKPFRQIEDEATAAVREELRGAKL